MSNIQVGQGPIWQIREQKNISTALSMDEKKTLCYITVKDMHPASHE